MPRAKRSIRNDHGIWAVNCRNVESDPFIRRYRNLIFVALFAAVAVAAFLMVAPFYPALIWAAVMAVLMTPIHRRIQKGKHPNLAATMTTLLTLAIIGLPILAIGAALFLQLNAFMLEMRQSAPSGQGGLSFDYAVTQIDAALKPIMTSFAPDFSLTAWFAEHREDLFRSLSAPAGKVLVSAGYSVFTLVTAFLTMFFMLRDGEKLREPTLDLIPLPREKGEIILAKLSDTIRAVFVGVVLVAVIQGTIAGITYYFVGIPHALLWGVATIVICTIPLLGAPILYIPMSLILTSQGKYVEAGILLGVGLVIVSQIDNILRPFIIGSRVELHPMAIFFSLLGGVVLLGPVGIMGGPMLLIVLLSLIEVVRERMRLSGTALEQPTAS